jgi:hypothetical protein
MGGGGHHLHQGGGKKWPVKNVFGDFGTDKIDHIHTKLYLIRKERRKRTCLN